VLKRPLSRLSAKGAPRPPWNTSSRGTRAETAVSRWAAPTRRRLLETPISRPPRPLLARSPASTRSPRREGPPSPRTFQRIKQTQTGIAADHDRAAVSAAAITPQAAPSDLADKEADARDGRSACRAGVYVSSASSCSTARRSMEVRKLVVRRQHDAGYCDFRLRAFLGLASARDSRLGRPLPTGQGHSCDRRPI
jgi:hypothetical protein